MRKLALIAALLLAFQSSSFAVATTATTTHNHLTNIEAEILNVEVGSLQSPDGLFCDGVGAAAQLACLAYGGDPRACQIAGELARDACNGATQ